jgi:hypothetical protein
MAGSGFVYSVRMPQTAITAAKTILQIKAGAAPIEFVEIMLAQITKTASELLEIQIIQYTGAVTAATVTAVSPLPLNPSSPAALAVSGTSATGYNASAEPSGGTANIINGGVFNVLNGEWLRIPVPEGREAAAQTKILTVKLLTAPAASMTFVAYAKFIEYQ